MEPACEFCGHAESEHRPDCRRYIIRTERWWGPVEKCACAFYVSPVAPASPPDDAYDAPGVPHTFDTWRTGRPWWHA